MASEQPAAPRSPSASPTPEAMPSLKSRIESRLAAIDSSSEDDEPVMKGDKTSGRASHKSNQASSDSEDEEEEEITWRPRGRLAAQMQAAATTTKRTPDAEEPESFMDRIQKRLGATVDKSRDSGTGDNEDGEEDAPMGDAEDNEEEDDIPVAPRRLQRRLQVGQTTPEKARSPAARSPSPGLFVSPDQRSPSKAVNGNTTTTTATEANDDGASDSDTSLPSLKNNSRFQALVERKRQERLAREAEEEKRRAERVERQKAMNVDLFDDEDDDGANVSDITDDEGGRKLSQAARPTRKAGKKAIEEMNRETQRLARNMQLAHEIKTRKKFSKADFLERFNFKRAAKADPKTTATTSSSSRPTTPVTEHQTDSEMKDPETPPSSPPVSKTATPAKVQKTVEALTLPVSNSDDEADLPALDNTFDASRWADKGKGKAIESPKKSPVKEAKSKRQVRIKLPQISAYNAVIDLDDEIQITGVKKSRLDAVFDSIPQRKAKESHAMQALRCLAQIKSPGWERRRRDEKPTMTIAELEFSLRQRARQQAKMEREKRQEYLKSKGIVIQTAEEREREMQEVEDIVAKARREAEEIMERERRLAKQEKKEKRKTGELDVWDDSDDEEYDGSENEADNEAEIELSGSEEEDEGEDASDKETNGNAAIDDEAMDSGSEQSEAEPGPADEDGLVESEDEFGLPKRNIRRSKKAQVISDDEDEGAKVEATPRPKTATQQSPNAPNTKSPAVPTSVLRSAKKTFIPGLPVTGAAGLGLTQIFAGTMDDSQVAPGTIPSQSLMPDFDSLPDSNLIGGDTQSNSMILDSQGGDTQRAETQRDSADGVHLHFTQSQAHGFDSLLRDDTATQMSIEPTQDVGLQDYTPLKSRFVEAPVSTVETMVLEGEAEPDTIMESPLVRRGRLRRKADAALSPVRQNQAAASGAVLEADEFGFGTTAFSVMKEAVQKQRRADEYNRKKSKAKEMVEEQAEESEDEYAGLGGADGEDSEDDDAASVKEMIDDENGMTAEDERKLAALYADRERASDEKMVDKLFHDITTGMLRRKRGADYDLSDSDDGGEARRRMKRRQFQKMQQALFADERIKKIAEKPGNQAFLRTIEDRGSDDEMDFLDFAAEPMETEEEESQSQSQAQGQQTVPDSQPATTTTTARRNPLAPGTSANPRPPAHTRRPRDGRKPSNLGEIRESVSSLLEDLNAEVVPATDPNSDSDSGSDGEGRRPSTSRSNKENQCPGRNPRRTAANSSSSRPAIIDRISLKRGSSSSSSSSNMSTMSSKLALAMPNAATGIGRGGASTSSSSGTISSFKVPPLLRRATTNSSSFISTSSNNATTNGFGDDGKIKKNASKRSGVSALAARENERRAAIQESDKRREARKWKGAERRVRAVGGLFGSGKFE